MVALNIKAFRGAVPRTSDRLLQPNQATVARNVKLTSGRIDPLKGNLPVYSTGSGDIKTLFRYRYASTAGNLDYWLTWMSDVDVVTSPLANDPQGRIYYTGELHEPRMSTFDKLSVGTGPFPAQFYALGLPLPTEAPTVTPSGGTAPTETRAYAYTFVTALGEESGPSPASTIATGNTNGTWALSNLQTAPPNSGTITAVANNSPSTGKVTLTLDSVFGIDKYDTLVFSGVGGMTVLNGTHRVADVNASAKTVVVDLLTAQTYTSGGTWTRAAAYNTTSMTKRIYRSAGSTGSFQFVAEISAATTTYNDTVAASALGETLVTLNTLPPPKNLTSLISLPNGCLVGLAGNQLCFSDPYMPYSWPESNRYSFSGTGVKLVSANASVIVLTQSYPILFSGTDPEAMSPTTMETYAPCVSKRGTVDVGGGALYPSQDGLYLASPSGVKNVTANLYRVDEWSALNPTSLVGAYRDNQYYGAYTNDTDSRILVLDMSSPDSVVEVGDTASAMFRNPYDGGLYLTKGGTVYKFDANAAQYYLSEWKSSTFQLGKPTNFAVAQVHADFPAIAPPDTAQIEANAALITNVNAVGGYIAGNELLALEVCGSYLLDAVGSTGKKVQFTLFADDVPVFSKEIVSTTPFRLPANYRAETFNIMLNASVKAYSVTVAQSTAELVQASV